MSTGPVVLRTARLTLEPVGVERAQRLCAGDYTGLVAGRGWPHDDSFDALGMAALAAGDADSGWFIVRSGEVIGEIGVKGRVSDLDDPATPPREVEIGYGLAVPARGRGFGTEAAAALVDHLLGLPAVAAVTAEVEPGNLASTHLLTKLGFDRVTGAEPGRTYWRRGH